MGVRLGTAFSGIGAPEFAMQRVFGEVENVFACEIDKFARESYLANHSVEHFHEDITITDFSKHKIDILVGGSPCQSFSMAGKRGGFEDTRGTLFYEFARALKESQPEYFIFENVKGMVNHDKGKTMEVVLRTFGELGYDITAKVLNSKEHGVPQNRERIFVVGVKNHDHIEQEMIRSKGKNLPDKLHNKMCDLYDEEALNYFHEFLWPKPIQLTRRLKDVLESGVDEKYYLSDKMLDGFVKTSENEGYINQPTQASSVFSSEKESPSLCAGTHGYAQGYIQVPSATTGDIVPNSKTRRGRVGKQVAQTLDTQCDQAVISDLTNDFGEDNPREYKKFSPTLRSERHGLAVVEPLICASRGRNKDRTAGVEVEQRIEINHSGTSNCLTSVQKDNYVLGSDYRIRKLTPRECLRLQDFPDTFQQVVSNSQMYKQAGNSMTVKVIELLAVSIQYDMFLKGFKCN